MVRRKVIAVPANAPAFWETWHMYKNQTLEFRKLATGKKQSQCDLECVRGDANELRRNLFSIVCSSQLLAGEMGNGGNPSLAGHGNLERGLRRKSRVRI